MSRSFNQSRPMHKNKSNRDYAKYKKTKMKPYGMHEFTGYGGEEYHPSRGGELMMTLRTKTKERKKNKIDINSIEDWD